MLKGVSSSISNMKGFYPSSILRSCSPITYEKKNLLVVVITDVGCQGESCNDLHERGSRISSVWIQLIGS